ncbi:monooxygenase [Aerococcus urinaehominis]|uniref:Monooxygenase n=1 Tax=Aerococcus urinaehominis TaxID=128944 RepID=A0A0X8FJR8_9LACT|nr:antibiotic biosynthesis monooxygenase [Aerococcus urinaehominis]AMB98582.1 monooxygenase [Aerococcus urinaehominis]SDL77104.1 Quinol monooxygenase YgiN [Aerococcus urinaehominis]
MAILVTIDYRGQAGSAQEFAHDMLENGIVDRIRQQAGNLAYQYYLPWDDQDVVRLVDVWTDQAAIDRHHASSMMAEIIALREKYDLTMTVNRYQISEDQVPDSDQAFIRA